MARLTQQQMDAMALRVLAVIRAYAKHGERCPSNGNLAERFGFQRLDYASRYLRRLERMGLIRVERGQCARVVEAADGSWRTAGDAGPVHWRDRRPAAASHQLGGLAPSETLQPHPGPRGGVSSLNCPAAASVAAGAFSGTSA